ncbi:MAG: hypothetical protein OXN20_10425 [Gemmatimonadota bacterium]|nr:hypothetical protein [Gemmatimonadota bacterium]
MLRSISCLICLCFIFTFSFSAQAQKTDLTKSFGIGLQGATPAFGGISIRYTGLAPVYLQTVGRFILNGQDSDHMLGAGVSYAIFDHQSRWIISRLYFSLEGGWRDKKEQDLSQEIVKSTTLAGGLAFGGELVFSLGGIPLGLNVEIGQGFGRKKIRSQPKDLAGVYLGGGIHAYF